MLLFIVKFNFKTISFKTIIPPEYKMIGMLLVKKVTGY